MNHQVIEIKYKLKCFKCEKTFTFTTGRAKEKCPHCNTGSPNLITEPYMFNTPEETIQKLKDIYEKIDKKYLEGSSNIPFGCWISDAIKMKGNHYDYYKEEYIAFFLTALNEFPNILKLVENKKFVKRY